jgi:hypothetical protein
MVILAEGSVEVVSKDTLSLLYFLLPGLVTAAIYYSLTAHPKKETFERVVQALIFTVTQNHEHHGPEALVDVVAPVAPKPQIWRLDGRQGTGLVGYQCRHSWRSPLGYRELGRGA